jgi:hypothetical protein
VTRWAAALLPLLAGGACRPAARPPAAPARPIADAALRNATYHLAFDPTRTVRLVDGAYADPADGDDGMKIQTRLLQTITRGVLPDGRAEAAVVLVTTAGGTGSFTDVALLADSAGVAQNVATVGLGAGVTVKAIRLYADSAAVTVVTRGPKDPACCPTSEQTRHYVLDGGRLIPTDPVPAATR